jgi:rhodanese-related sulfurtransferase
MDLMSRMFSPYDLNPAGTNPLTAILDSIIDFSRLREAPIKLFVTATNVHTGKGRVFRNAEITSNVQAIEIDGERYWDGGYSGNPTMTPLVRECRSQDTILVQINPIGRKETRRSARAILNRVNEVAFNSVLLAMWNQSRMGGVVTPASTRIDRRPGQPSVNAVTSVSSARPTARRLCRISADVSRHGAELDARKCPVVVVCKTDRRSAKAAADLLAAGLTDVRVLRGGTDAWHRQGLPLE